MEEQRDVKTHPDLTANGQGTVNDQASAWIMKLMSGSATEEDAEALQRWRRQSPAHRLAFAEAKLLWDALGPAANDVARRMKPSGEMPGAVAATVRPAPRIGRRAFIGGALAASVATVGYVGSKPPYRFWSSFNELVADYRTGVGEQQKLTLADDVSLVLNTQTSIDLKRVPSGSRAIELISGEAAISAKVSGSFDVIAADGWAKSTVGRFNMRRDGATVRVMCLEGLVEVGCRDQVVTIPPGHQVTYDGLGLQPVKAVDLSIATAWQRGQLIFRHEPLARVVEEVNRYRPGRIVLLNDKLGERDVVATFQLSRIGEVAEHLARTFGANIRSLPGGVVLLS